jgi:hypothetical protein
VTAIDGALRPLLLPVIDRLGKSKSAHIGQLKTHSNAASIDDWTLCRRSSWRGALRYVSVVAERVKTKGDVESQFL